MLHPHWNALIQWLAGHGMDISLEKLPVEARSSPDAGYGLFALRSIDPTYPLFSIPPKALLNSVTLAPHYPPSQPKLTCTQFVSLHLLLHRPTKGQASSDPLFGPYISVLPQDFESHPLTWLWKKENLHGNQLEARLIDALPPRVLEKLDKMGNLFEMDWNTTKAYLSKNPAFITSRTKDSVNTLEEDYLWAWLNVNTRCVYHRLKKSRSDPDNMTLCPILDFANHSNIPPYCMPKPTNSEIWNTGLVGKGKFGEEFVLLSPSTATSDEIFLRYGAHSNATLFSEYGFVLPQNTIGASGDDFIGEFEVYEQMENLFKKRGALGVWMKETLLLEGYWGDWIMYLTPTPAHPSYRLITALRLYHIIPLTTTTVPSNSDQLLDQWRNTILGHQDTISNENEALWRGTLMVLCQDAIRGGEIGLERTRKIGMIGSEATRTFPIDYVKTSIESLWQEEVDIAAAVMRSLENNVEF